MINADAYFDELEKVAAAQLRGTDLAEHGIGMLRRKIQKEMGLLAQERAKLDAARKAGGMFGRFKSDYRTMAQGFKEYEAQRLAKVRQLEAMINARKVNAADAMRRAPSQFKQEAAQRQLELINRGGTPRVGPVIPNAAAARVENAANANINPANPRLGLLDSSARRTAALGVGGLGLAGAGYLYLNNQNQGYPQGY